MAAHAVTGNCVGMAMMLPQYKAAVESLMVAGGIARPREDSGFGNTESGIFP